MRKTTKDQKFSIQDGSMRAEIDVYMTKEVASAPSIRSCRHAALTIQNVNSHDEVSIAYVVYDRLLCRIVSGIYRRSEDALLSAKLYNEQPESPQEMAPNGYALGLTYPTNDRDEDGE